MLGESRGATPRKSRGIRSLGTWHLQWHWQHFAQHKLHPSFQAGATATRGTPPLPARQLSPVFEQNSPAPTALRASTRM